jgi:GDP-D-mannose dehydratase
LLLEKGYQVYGMVRRSSVEKFDRVEHIKDKLHLIQGDLTDQSSLYEAIKEIQPDEIYDLAAQSFVPTSWNQPTLTAEVTAVGATRILEAIRKHKPDIKYYQASSSEMFGKVSGKVPGMKRPLHLRVRDKIINQLPVKKETKYLLGLSDSPAIMEMHCFERSELEVFLRKHGGVILAVERYDAAGPGFISYRYYVTKKHGKSTS